MSFHYHSCQSSSDIVQSDDGASSIASFEEVGRFSQKQSAHENSCFNGVDQIESDAVPEVKYVLQYKNRGNVVESKSTLHPKTYKANHAQHTRVTSLSQVLPWPRLGISTLRRRSQSSRS